MKVKSISDIAYLAGVSKSTVSRALNNSSKISQKTKDLIEQIAKENNFAISEKASGLSNEKSGVIGCLYAKKFINNFQTMDARDNFQSSIITLLAYEYAHQKIDLLLMHADDKQSDWKKNYYLTKKVDGFIVLPPYSWDSKLLSNFIEMDVPFVSWHRPLQNLVYPSVIVDNYEGSQKIMQHLYNTGKRKIAYIGNTWESIEMEERFNGVISSYKKLKLDFKQEYLKKVDYGFQGGFDAAFELLTQIDPPDAIYASADLLAIGAINAAKKLNYSIPEDVAICGFDNMHISESYSPSLTTMDQAPNLIAKLMVSTLNKRIDKKSIDNPVITPQLIVRDST